MKLTTYEYVTVKFIFNRKKDFLRWCIIHLTINIREVIEWMGVFNYPGDDYVTNVFNQIVIFLSDLSEEVITSIEFIGEEGLNDEWVIKEQTCSF